MGKKHQNQEKQRTLMLLKEPLMSSAGLRTFCDKSS